MNSMLNLLYQDGIYWFYEMPAQRAGTVFIIVKNVYNEEVFRGLYLKNFGANPTVKVRRGKSGTYVYYKITFRCESVAFEIILQNNGVLKEVYRDLQYVDYNKTRLVITTRKGGINVTRKSK